MAGIPRGPIKINDPKLPKDIKLSTSLKTLGNMINSNFNNTLNNLTSNATLRDMKTNPSNQFEAFADREMFLERTTVPARRILFLLQQELLYANNIKSNHFVNPFAIQGLVPFSGGLLPTTFDNTLLPGTDAKSVAGLGGQSARTLGARLGWNIGQLEANFESSGNIIDTVRDSVKNTVAKLLGVSTESSEPTTKKGKSIEDYLAVNDRDPIDSSLVAQRANYFDVNLTSVSERDKDNLLKGSQFPFYFKSLNYASNSEKLYMFFQGIINNISESYNPNWVSEEIFGRPHPLWIYSNVNRSINLEFMIIAKSFDDLDRIRERADWLSKHTYPTLASVNGQASHFKSGPFISITIGNLFENLNGFISSLEFDWNAFKRWELQNGSVFPQGLKVVMRFNVLESKLIHNTDSDTVNVYNPFNNVISTPTNISKNIPSINDSKINLNTSTITSKSKVIKMISPKSKISQQTQQNLNLSMQNDANKLLRELPNSPLGTQRGVEITTLQR